MSMVVDGIRSRRRADGHYPSMIDFFDDEMAFLARSRMRYDDPPSDEELDAWVRGEVDFP